jgi:hypothetical protein
VPLCSSSTRLGYVAPELCKRVALRASSTAVTESSAATTKSRAVTPSDTRPSTSTGNLTTKGGASKPPAGESAGEPARNAMPKLGEKPTKKLSAYETERNENITHNRELLAQLDLQTGVQQPRPQPKEKVKRLWKVTDPVPESERRRGRSAGQPSTMYVHFHFHLCAPLIMGIYIQV